MPPMRKPLPSTSVWSTTRCDSMTASPLPLIVSSVARRLDRIFSPAGVQDRCRDFVEPKLRLAERARFELARLVRVCRFSRPVHSTALPPLQARAYYLQFCSPCRHFVAARSGGRSTLFQRVQNSAPINTASTAQLAQGPSPNKRASDSLPF